MTVNHTIERLCVSPSKSFQSLSIKYGRKWTKRDSQSTKSSVRAFAAQGAIAAVLSLSKADDDDHIHIVGSRFTWMCAFVKKAPALP